MRLAVVGAGPKALFCVERLVARGPARGPLRIVVLDPAPPGTGAAYATGLSTIWRLNVTSAVVDAAVRGGDAPTPFAVPTFDQWRAARGEAAPLDPYPPRALVGCYLADQWRAVAAHLPAGWTLEHRRATARRLTRAGGRWSVDGEEFDEVLLATGHAADWPGALRHGWSGPVPLVPAVYPCDGLDAIPAQATVVLRGAALTFLDAALALTEGRGGAFAAHGAVPRYVPGPEQVYRLVPVSRTGRFMVPKPDPRWVAPLGLAELAGPAAHRIRARPGDVAAALGAVEATAGRYLARAGGTTTDAPLPVAGLNRRGRGRSALAQLDHDVAVAAGTAAPDATWALGQAWRDLYGALVAALSFERPTPRDWRRFAAAAAALEPVGFGPPLVNARKLQALGRAGILDDAALTGRLSLHEALARARDLTVPDGLLDTRALTPGTPAPTGWAGVEAVVVAVDAVLPPPGITTGLLAHAEIDELLCRAPGRRGVRVDADLACLDARGARIPGLSAVGRPTEDVVVGNDTLDRRLHDGPDRWARRVLRRM